MGQQEFLNGQEEVASLSSSPCSPYISDTLETTEAVSLFSRAVCYLVGSSLPPSSASPISVVVGPQLFILGAPKIGFPCAAVNCWKGRLVLAFCYTERGGILQMIETAEKK